VDTGQKGIVIKRRIVVPSKKKDLELNTDNKEAFRLRLMRNQLAYERRYKKTLKPIMIVQRAESLRNLEAHASSLKKKDLDQKLFDDAAADATMVEKIKPVLKELVKQQGSLALIFAGDDENEFQFTTPLETFLQNSTVKMASGFNDETLLKLNVTLAEGIQLGESLDKLRKRVESVYDDIDRYRANRLARTETLKASNAATNFAYKQTGYVKAKEWYVNPDSCPICAEMEGKTVPLDDEFLPLGDSVDYTDEEGEEQSYPISYDTIETPPLHPNCRCTILPVR
jgi:SPP1 gp7 family putative phage head morphogenesis protein